MTDECLQKKCVIGGGGVSRGLSFADCVYC